MSGDESSEDGTSGFLGSALHSAPLVAISVGTHPNA